ncbi:phosphoribosylaminoimidazole-succinocarboxamide synthase [Weissella uvarum]|uniref:phosphoribosylaminoimidazolesuccinocarboxamide synthase n=1 Tax=Weissella uvarum TaxID=1479233 RepID=UPI00195F5185|nr:phosphoribosylaminoimidazolesuccinocarboxamide synthase [Weissella uvarum]MBM7617498.1 phosphoribosylaminoimidazole-succinocarboxamide synthase [Weissella uvarum]MCM0595618.1 phosphoribosylaminoimidazolesuccinocarboxamide synthase [Weissella uvarum]
MPTIEREKKLTEGKAKRIYQTSDSQYLWVENLNQATALNGRKKEQIADKGYYTNQISRYLFQYLQAHGVPNHFVREMGPSESLVQALNMIPLEVVVRNYAAGHFVSRFKVPEHQELTPAVHEMYFKADALDDPFMNDSQIITLQIATAQELSQMNQLADEVNACLSDLFLKLGLTLVDFKLEFGRDQAGTIVLGDELSPDNMRLIDTTSGQSFDKDVFRNNSGDLTTSYAGVLTRLQQQLGE